MACILSSIKYLTVTLFLSISICYAQYNPKDYFAFDNLKEGVFIDNFDSLKKEWKSVGDTTDDPYKCLNTNIEEQKDGKLYGYNDCDDDISYDAMVNVDYRRNFEIILIAKVAYHKDSNTLSWGGVLWDITDTGTGFQLFSFSGDWYNRVHTHKGLDNQDKCIGKSENFKKYKKNIFNKFVRYTIRKYKDKYYIFINGMLWYNGTYENLNGTNISLKVSRRSHIEFDHLGIYYLPD